MQKLILENEIRNNLSIREIAKKYSKSYTSIRYWLKKYELKTCKKQKILLNCIICNKELTGTQSKYCSLNCKSKALNSYGAQKNRAIYRKKEFIEKLGGKCSICCYNKNIAGLVFHHIDTSKKKFEINGKSLSNLSIKKLYEELDKCILLCQNCHMELHYPHLTNVI